MGLSTQVQQCFGKGHPSISPRVGRGDEHRDGLVAPLFNSVSADLVHFIFQLNTQVTQAGNVERGVAG